MKFRLAAAYILLSISTVLLSISAVAAQDHKRAALPGYGGFLFGMTEQQARSVKSLSAPIPEPTRTRFKLAEPATVDGIDYVFSVTLMKGKLDTILLSSDTKETDTGCQYNFNRVVSLVQTKYGPPDRAPSEKVYSRIARFRDATFTFQDGNAIVVSSVYIETCLINVAYMAGKKGGSF
jgi:hypothetical protein